KHRRRCPSLPTSPRATCRSSRGRTRSKQERRFRATTSDAAAVVGSRRVTVSMDAQRQKQLVLLLARAFASNLSTPALLADTRGYLVYYNEAAELVVGKRFAETGEVPLDEWLDPFAPPTSGGELLPPKNRPTSIALRDPRPAHLRYTVTSSDGVEREIEVSAFPLFAHADEFVGAI